MVLRCAPQHLLLASRIVSGREEVGQWPRFIGHPSSPPSQKTSDGYGRVACTGSLLEQVSQFRIDQWLCG
jgi:hypothetical protein